MIKKHGSAKWSGGIKDGKGTVSTESGALSENPYGFNTRFEGQAGTNPEELIGAAHASCFSMALSLVLGEKGLTPEEIQTGATVSLEKQDGGFAITGIHLDVTAKVPEADDQVFREAADAAKANCPVSKLMTADITMDAKLA